MDNDSVINELNTVLRGELMAAESYDLFISNTDDEKIRQIFGQFRADHRRHAELLAERIRSLGAAPGKERAYRACSRKSSWSSKPGGKIPKKYSKELISARIRV